MDTAKILRAWDVFKKNFPEIDRRDRLMRMNFEFGLGDDFQKEDLTKMEEAVDKCIQALMVIKGGI